MPQINQGRPSASTSKVREVAVKLKMKVKGSRVAAANSASSIAPRCVKYHTSVQKLKSIDLDAIGDRKNNVLLDLMRCQVKADKSKCQKESKLYETCHAGVMGIGNFEGRKNCGKELEVLYRCLFSA